MTTQNLQPVDSLYHEKVPFIFAPQITVSIRGDRIWKRQGLIVLTGDKKEMEQVIMEITVLLDK